MDGRLIEFSKPFGDIVKPKRVYPKGTGYIHNLYTLRGFPENIASQVEQHFLQPLDSTAAITMRKLVTGVSKSNLSNSEVVAWSRFLLSLLLRMPEDIDILRQRWREKLEEISLETRIVPAKKGTETSHDLFSYAVANPPDDEIDEMVFNIFMDLTSSDRTANHFCNMQWGVVEFKDSPYALYLSDRPVVRLAALSASDGAMIVPLSPRHLFIAANRQVDLRSYLGMHHLPNLKDANKLVVSQALKFAYASDDKCLRFMQNHLATSYDVRAMQGTSFLSKKA
jgi:hypothetical protein